MSKIKVRISETKYLSFYKYLVVTRVDNGINWKKLTYWLCWELHLVTCCCCILSTYFVSTTLDLNHHSFLLTHNSRGSKVWVFCRKRTKPTSAFLPHWIRSCLKNVWAQSGTIRPPTAISFRFQVFLTSHSLFIAKYIILWVIQVFVSICICRFHQKILAFYPLRHEFILKVSIKISDMTNAVTSIVDILVHLMISLFLAKLFQWKYFLTFNPIRSNKTHSFPTFLWDFVNQKGNPNGGLIESFYYFLITEIILYIYLYYSVLITTRYDDVAWLQLFLSFVTNEYYD